MNVEVLSFGRYKVTWDPCVFDGKCDKRAPVINVTPCESGVLKQVIGKDADGNDIILSELFPSEQAVVLCEHVDNKSAIIITGRNLVRVPKGPPVVTGDVDFYIHAVQAGCC